MNKDLQARLLDDIKRYNHSEDEFLMKEITVVVDTGFTVLQSVDAVCAVPKNIANSVEYVTVDFQCTAFKFFDKEDKLIFESITALYDDLGTPTAFVEYDKCA